MKYLGEKLVRCVSLFLSQKRSNSHTDALTQTHTLTPVARTEQSPFLNTFKSVPSHFLDLHKWLALEDSLTITDYYIHIHLLNIDCFYYMK